MGTLHALAKLLGNLDAGLIQGQSALAGFLDTSWIQPSSTTSLNLTAGTLGMAPRSVGLSVCYNWTFNPWVTHLTVKNVIKSLSLSSEPSLSAKCSAHHLLWFWTINYSRSAGEYWFGYWAVASLTPPHTYIHTHSYTHTVWWFSGALGQRKALGLADFTIC